jgi:hypothetical protein
MASFVITANTQRLTDLGDRPCELGSVTFNLEKTK